MSLTFYYKVNKYTKGGLNFFIYIVYNKKKKTL